MYSYALLEPECYYIIEEKENEPLTLIQVRAETDSCMFVLKYKDQTLSEWKRKTDPIHDIIELLSDEAIKNWSNAYYNNEDAFYGEDDE